MKNKYLFSTLILALILILGSFFYVKKTSQDSLKITTLQKNITWGTNYQSEVPYKKGDTLELSYIIEGNGIYSGNFLDLEKKFSIKNITINGKKTSSNDLKNININKDSPIIIKFDVVSKENKTTQNSSDITFQEISKNIDNQNTIEEVKKEISGKPTRLVLSQENFNSNINNILILRGQNLASIKFLMIGEKSFNPIIDNNFAYITIPKNTFGAGDYFIIANTFDNEIITFNSKIHFDYSKNKINISFITPQKINNKDEKIIILQGNGFNKLISLQLSNNIVLKNTSFQIINDNVLAVKIPKNIPIGNYSFNLMDTTGIYEETKILKIVD